MSCEINIASCVVKEHNFYVKHARRTHDAAEQAAQRSCCARPACYNPSINLLIVGPSP